MIHVRRLTRQILAPPSADHPFAPDVDALRSEIGMNARCALGRVQAAGNLRNPPAELTILPRDDSFLVGTQVRNLALPFNRISLKPRKSKGNVKKSTQREHK